MNSKTPLINKAERREEDRSFYEEIWIERNHISDLTGNKIYGELLSSYFHHLLCKELYPQFRHCKWNICLCEDYLHAQIETNSSLLPTFALINFIILEDRAKKLAKQSNV